MRTNSALETILSQKRENQSFSLDGDQLDIDRSRFLESDLEEVDVSFRIFEEEIGVNKRKSWKENFLNGNLCFLFDGC
jgi:hypothetical protein